MSNTNGNGISNGSANGAGNGSQDEPQGLVFPCDFPLKMFGKNTLHFIAAVDKTVEEHVPREDWASTKTTPSKNEKSLIKALAKWTIL